MVDEHQDLPLFTGRHIPAFRYQRALERLDLRAAAADAPAEWRAVVLEMAAAVEGTSLARADLDRLRRCARTGWPAVLERAWQRLVGRSLDGYGIPRTLDGEPAAAYLLRGGEHERAAHSLRRHLAHHPRDAAAWAFQAHFEPVRAAARCAFHGGPVLDAAGPVLDLVREDDISPPGPWLLSYAWFSRAIDLDEIAHALTAEGILTRPPLLIPGDARAFAWYVLDAGGRPFGGDAVGIVEARERLQRISPAAFRRYLARVAGH